MGKSCLMMQFTDKKFKNDNDPTIGVEFGSRSTTINGKNLKLQIWDTAGQESFRSITRSYFRGAIGSLLVFDLTDRESFNNLSSWVEETRTCASSNIVIIMIGNKCDLTDQRKISTEEATDFAKNKGIIYIETSAKTALNVEKAFETIGEIVLDHIEKGYIDPANEGGIKMGSGAIGKTINLNQSSKSIDTSGNGCSC